MKGITWSFDLYEMFKASKVGSNSEGKSYTDSDQMKWHSRNGYSPKNAINQSAPLVKLLGRKIAQLVVDWNIRSISKPTLKSKKLADKKPCWSCETLDLVHWNFCGPIGIPSIGNAKYFVNLYYDASAVSLVCFVEIKYQTSLALKDMIAKLESGCSKLCSSASHTYGKRMRVHVARAQKLDYR